MAGEYGLPAAWKTWRCMMRVRTTKATDVYALGRFDSKFFLEEGQLALDRHRSGKWPLVTVGEVFGPENIWSPNRFERVRAESQDYGTPILVLYDCFRYLPHSDYFLSKTQVSIYSTVEVKRGWLLIVCSGRNLGPVV